MSPGHTNLYMYCINKDTKLREIPKYKTIWHNITVQTRTSWGVHSGEDKSTSYRIAKYIFRTIKKYPWLSVNV